MDSYHAALETASRLALDYLESLDRRPVATGADRASLLQGLDRPLADEGIPPQQVITELARDAEPGIIGSAGGRFFGWVIGGALPSAVAADWLSVAWDQNAALSACAPAAAVVEEIAGAWLKELLGLPAHASFAFVGGCQMAHVTCLAAARHALLEKRGWNVEERGLTGAPPIRIISSDQRHGTFERAVRLVGLGSANVEYLAADPQSRLSPDALAHALEKDNRPAIVLLQAGEINTGEYDPFAKLIPIAHRHDAWVHVDGAFGLWAAASPRFRHLLAGVELADSWATDGHKWLNVPYDSGYAFIAHPEPHRASMTHRAAYLTHNAVMRDQMDWNPDWSRRARGFSTYAALRELGRNGVAAMIDRCCDHALDLVDGLGCLPGVEVLWRPSINQGLVRFLDPNGADHDRRTDQVIGSVQQRGEAFFTGTTWRGMRAMRISVCNWQTGEADVRRTVNAVASVLYSPCPQ
ncbi:MAG TPA: aminotransferase class V-fold PLP-dependent enzyme [Bryobacteraceae bacterium]|jgi:glutamate/tyrosine decarboxylase-like PLP-dependent enzyme|nr:aminotransferase class V-fold PLP-dependent enzyme [Bryobacteraceae bacterium]